MTLRFKLILAAAFLCCGLSSAFAGSMPTYVDVVASVYGTPTGTTTITGLPVPSGTFIYAAGYYAPKDGGSGYFSKVPGVCKTSSLSGTVPGSVPNNELDLSTHANVPLVRGMGIDVGSFALTIDSVIDNPSGQKLFLSSNVSTGSYSSVTIYSSANVDGGRIVADHAGNCWQRTSAFTGNVREWGASCDVQTFSSKAQWIVTSSVLDFPSFQINPNPALQPRPGEFIAITQIGTVPNYALPNSSLSSGGSGYAVGDVVAFTGGTPTQELGIVVDSVDGSGKILTWHFLWGGQYTGTLPTSMSQDNSGSKTSGTLATFSPAWSGWTVVNTGSAWPGTPGNPGSGYAVGDFLTLDWTTTQHPNQNQKAQVIVDSIAGGGGISTFHFANYGSYSDVPLGPSGVAAVSGGSVGSGGATFFPSNGWSNGTLASYITTVTSNGSRADISVAYPNPPLQVQQPIQYWYFGHDDGAAINNALANAPANADVILPANCGSTVEIDLPDSGFQQPSTALRGLSSAGSGIYALGAPGITPMSHLIYKGTTSTDGGGLKNMVVEGMGIPQGKGPVTRQLLI